MLTDFFTRNHVEWILYIVDPQYSDNYREILGTQFQFSYSANWAIKCHMFSNPNRDRLDKCNKGRRKKKWEKAVRLTAWVDPPLPHVRPVVATEHIAETASNTNCSADQLFSLSTVQKEL